MACAATIFSIAALSALLLTLLLNTGAIAAIVLMSLITGANHGVNLMLIGHVPKRFRKYGNISTVSGAINSCTYIGSAIATYGIAKISESFGWSVTVLTWCVIAVLGTLCCIIAMPKWKAFIEK